MSTSCPFENIKNIARTDIPNHSIIHKKGYSFIEFNRDFFENAIDSLKDRMVICASGLDEFAPHEKLLVNILQEFGFSWDKTKKES